MSQMAGSSVASGKHVGSGLFARPASGSPHLVPQAFPPGGRLPAGQCGEAISPVSLDRLPLIAGTSNPETSGLHPNGYGVKFAANADGI